MKKFLLLIPLFLFSLMASAKVIEVASGTSNIIHYTIANAATEDGDEIVLTDNGPYISTKGEDYTKLVKNLTIKAAPGIHPVIQLEVPFRSSGGKSVKFSGITFDGTSLHNDYEYYFRFYDNADNLEFEDCEFKNISKYLFQVYSGKSANSLKLTNCKLHDISSRGILNQGTLNNLEINGCEIYNFTEDPVLDNYGGATLGKVKIYGTEFYNNAKDIISGAATSHADSCIINNCYFHSNSRSAIYFAASTVSGVETCDGVIVKNSTFANNDLSASSRSVIDVLNNGGTVASNIEVKVDHCTFYNNTTKNYDYSCVRSYKSTKVSITNSIFAYPTAIEFYATNCYGGTISNTLVYNLSKGHRSSSGAPAITNTITANPLFVDAANGDFSLVGNWATGSISPARGAATDGSDLGDPRWYTDEVLPESNFISPCAFVGAKAKISGNLWYNSESDYLFYNDKEECGVATWKIHATKAGALKATLNMNAGTSTGHKFKVEILDADGNSIGDAAEPSQSNAAGDIDIPTTISIPAIGDYTVKLYNLTPWSAAKINGFTLAYVGGAVQNIPCTILPFEALRSSRAYIDANGEFRFTSDEEHSHVTEQWAKWNIRVSKEGCYKFATSVKSPNGQSYVVTIYNSDETVEKGSASLPETGNYGYARTFSTDFVYLEEGDYIIKVQNTTNYSNGRVVNIVATYERGARQNIPGQIIGEDAMICKEVGGTHDIKMTHLDNGDLKYDSNNGHPLEEYALWNIHATAAVTGKVILHLPEEYASSGHEFHVELYSSIDGEKLAEAYETAQVHTRGLIALEQTFTISSAGNYLIKLVNHTQWSSAVIRSISIAPLITIADTETNDATVIGANDGYTVNAQLTRSFNGGEYNTLCLPFDVSAAELARVFPGAKVKELTSSSLEEDGYALYLNFSDANSLQAGKPYLIMPAEDIADPTFLGVTIDNSFNNVETTNADFTGTFVKQTITGNPNNLFLGAENKLQFSSANITIKGLRAYFTLKVGSGAAPRRARLVMNEEQIATDVELIDGQLPDHFGSKVQKFIENGQLIIVKDGVYYNAFGVRVK